jgi:3-dehydro-4-phosphotetronate decarboxylase
MNETQARDEICRVGRSLFERGYVHSTAGNISVRIADGFLITPTDACLGFLDPAKISKVSGEGAHLTGDAPSKTLALHRAIYGARGNESFGCVLHTHSTHLVALSLRAHFVGGPVGEPELLAPITPYFVMKVGHVPVVRYATPGAAQVASQVSTLIERYAERNLTLRAVMIERLGPNVWHTEPARAMALLEELEETAKLALLSPDVTPLSEPEIEALRTTFKASW